MMPLNLMGSLIGAFMYVWLPDLILMTILTLLLVVLSIESIRKYMSMRKQEDEIEAKKEVKSIKAEEKAPAEKDKGEVELAKITLTFDEKKEKNLSDGDDTEATAQRKCEVVTTLEVDPASSSSSKIDETRGLPESTGDPQTDKRLAEVKSLVK